MEEVWMSSISCIAIILIILFGVVYQKGTKSKTVKPYIWILTITIFYLIINLLTEVLDGNINLVPLLYVLNFITYVSMDAIVVAFCFYLSFYFESKNSKNGIVIYVICAIRVITLFVLLVTDNLFGFDENGCFIERENLLFIPYVISAVTLGALMLYTILHRKNLSPRQFIVALTYQLLPAVALVLELIFEIYSFLGVAITLSCVMIYVLMQNSNIEKEKLKANVFEDIANKDLLTNMKNRRAYYSFINEIKEDEYVGAIFCDVNKLKYTNDHYGHKAGDDLLVKFANILVDLFGRDRSFRISGDEFVVVLSMDEESFKEKVNQLQKAIDENNKISALGFAFGKGCRYENLIIEAEDKMYEDKKQNSPER